jgi:hypothetical protein
LVRDAKQYNDPANGLKGNLFEVEYTDGKKLKFRKHNSKINPDMLLNHIMDKQLKVSIYHLAL